MSLLNEALRGASAADRDQFRPVILRPSGQGDRERLADLLKHEPGITVHDNLRAQVRELVKALNPSVKWESGALDRAAEAHLEGHDPVEYGAWVYYPWTRRLVHLLDEAEFALVRTDRNRNKITKEEQDILGAKRVGVIGLSVGQSVSLALAMERGFGELRLADFDSLDLSNLNRIRSGVHHLGVNKAVIAAREIAEIDPYLHVTVFTEGITERNLDAFFEDGGRLDLLVEECDSVAVKILARQKAKSLRIPVVMDTSDRGLIDVERFDLEPDRPILHGLVDHLDLSLAAKARTNEEKLPFVVPIIGLDTMSVRMKASMLEIESTVGTWPQLASAVMLGGALVAEIHRRIALGQFTSSGRWYIDPEEILRDDGDRAMTTEPPRSDASPALTEEVMESLAGKLDIGPPARPFTAVECDQLTQAAILAPSAGNLQPWRFMHSEGRVLLFHDGASGDSPLDGGRLIPAIDMGTCLENMRLKALELGLEARIMPYPADDHRLVAAIDCMGKATERDPLAAHMPARCTNRRKGDARPLPDGVALELDHAAGGVAGCAAHVIADREALRAMAEVIGSAERLRVLHPLGHHDLFRKELRWTSHGEARPLDGLEMATLELKNTEEVGFRVAADRRAMDMLAGWDAGRGFMKMNRENFESASGLLLISCMDTTREGLLNAGRAVQRVWLKATELGLAVHPCAAPILLSHHVRYAGGKAMEPHYRTELMQLFNELCDSFALAGREPVFMMRLSYAPPPTVRSLRRPLSAQNHSQYLTV